MARKQTAFWFNGLLRYFSEHTTMHGLRYIGMQSISKIERIFWAAIGLVTIIYTFILIQSNFEHFLTNPTVVTIEKDFRNWENPFPAATICYVNKVDPGKARQFIIRKLNISSDKKEFETYMDFINTVSNLTYKSFKNLLKFNNESALNNVDMIELLTEVHPDLTGTLVTFQTKIPTEWKFVLTELGLCSSVNSGFEDLLSPRYSKAKTPQLGTKKEHLKCHYLNGLCYARYDSDPEMPIEYHIHSHLEVIHYTSEPPLLVRKNEEVDCNFRLTETYATSEIRYLSVNQRKCRFDDEPFTRNLPAYSITLCYMECRYRWALEACGCKPFFYTFLDGKVCDIKGLLCLSNHSAKFSEMSRCNCPQPCNLMTYLKQDAKVMKWDMAYFDQRITFRWGLIPPTTKYHRNILFGFQELIVSIGGIMSLFMGASFIGLQENFYLIFKYLYFYVLNRKL